MKRKLAQSLMSVEINFRGIIIYLSSQRTLNHKINLKRLCAQSLSNNDQIKHLWIFYLAISFKTSDVLIVTLTLTFQVKTNLEKT